jgi:hypothetical protein
LNEIEQRLQNLTNAILTGKTIEAKQSSYAVLARGGANNDVLDAVTDAVKIIMDLNSVGEFDADKLISAENAVVASLQALEDRLIRSQGRFKIKATVGSLGLEAGNLLSPVVCAWLRSIGFEALNLSKVQTPLDLLRNSEELRADLVIPLLAREDAEGQLTRFLQAIERGGFKSKFEVIPMALGLRDAERFPIAVVTNPSEVISRATEWAVRKKSARHHM